jgi:hypothetical protein
MEDSIHRPIRSTKIIKNLLTKLFLPFLLLLQTPLCAKTTGQEQLFAQRILELCDGNDDAIVQKEIKNFINLYPLSQCIDPFKAILGDSLLRQHQYEQALNAYASIQSEELQSKTFDNRMHCLYHLNKFASLLSELKGKIQNLPEHPTKPEDLLYLYYFAESNLALTQGNVKGSDFTNYLEAAKKAYNKLKATPYLTKALQGLAKVYSLQGHKENAVKIYQQLAEAVEFEKNSLLFKQGKWSECRQGFLDMIKKNPDSKNHSSSIQYLPKCTLKELQEKCTPELQQQLIDDLELTLSTCPNTEHTHELHLLLAKTYYEGPKDLRKFNEHTEKALELKPDLPNRSSILLTLFNSNLKLAANEPSQQKKLLLEKAATYLTDASKDKKVALSEKQRLWLTNHLYSKISEKYNPFNVEPISDKKDLEDASKCLQTLLSMEKSPSEKNLYKISTLYGWLNNKNKQNELLITLSEKSQKAEIIFSLACLNMKTNKNTEALKTFQELSKITKGCHSYIIDASKMFSSQLTLEKATKESKEMLSHDVLEALNTLKELQVRKKLSQEPIHLEAALEYAKIQSSIEKEKNKDEHYLFLLNRIKEDFNSKDDLSGKEYHLSKGEYPRQNKIFQAYMMLLDAHITKQEALLAAKKSNSQEAQWKKEAANNIYKNLLKEEYALTKYLIKEASEGISNTPNQNLKTQGPLR